MHLLIHSLRISPLIALIYPAICSACWKWTEPALFNPMLLLSHHCVYVMSLLVGLPLLYVHVPHRCMK